MSTTEPYDPQPFFRQHEEAMMQRQALQQENLAERKAFINRANAQHSTGPRTPEGKAVSCQNRLSHGLCSSSLLVPGESQADFDLLHAEMTAAYAPVHEQERMLTDQLVVAQWRLNRAYRIENHTHDIVSSNAFADVNVGTNWVDPNPDYLIAISMFNDNNAKVIARVQRYVTSFERNYNRVLKTLQQALKERPAVVEAPVKLKAAAAGSALPEIGFVPKSVPFASPSAPAYVDRC